MARQREKRVFMPLHMFLHSDILQDQHGSDNSTSCCAQRSAGTDHWHLRPIWAHDDGLDAPQCLPTECTNQRKRPEKAWASCLRSGHKFVSHLTKEELFIHAQHLSRAGIRIVNAPRVGLSKYHT